MVFHSKKQQCFCIVRLVPDLLTISSSVLPIFNAFTTTMSIIFIFLTIKSWKTEITNNSTNLGGIVVKWWACWPVVLLVGYSNLSKESNACFCHLDKDPWSWKIFQLQKELRHGFSILVVPESTYVRHIKK